MPKSKRKSQRQAVSKQELGELLTQQSSVILQAVDEGFATQDKRIEERFVVQNIAFSAAMDKRLATLEERFTQKLNGLTTAGKIPAAHDRHGRRFHVHQTRRESHQSCSSREARCRN